MIDPVQRRRDVDAQWENYAQSMHGFYRRLAPGVLFMVLSAVAGAWVGPIWSGEIATAAPRLFAIALAIASVACFAGFVYIFAKFQMTAPPPRMRPSRGSKAAFLLREWSASQRRGSILVCCGTQLLFAWSLYRAFGRDDTFLQFLGAAPILVGLVTVLMVFALGVQDDEFETAMRARAAQIGYWTALIVVTGVMAAGLWLGIAVLPLLPVAFMLLVVVPCLSYVALTHERRER